MAIFPTSLDQRQQNTKIVSFCRYGLHKSWLPLQWRHNGLDGVSNHQPHHCLLNRLFGRRSKKTSKLRVTGLCVGNSPGTGEFPTQMASNAENVSIWWRHHVNHSWKTPDIQGHVENGLFMEAHISWNFELVWLLRKVGAEPSSMNFINVQCSQGLCRHQ